MNNKLSVRKEIQPRFVEQLNEKAKVDMASLTPMERSKLRKAERTQAEFDKLKNAAADAKLNHSIGASLK